MNDHEPQRILLVDDTAANLCALARVLSDFDTMLAPDGAQALHLLHSTEVLPDLILLDVMMPGDDGFEICRRLKADPALAHIPIIFMTGLGDAEHETKGLAVGGVDYITKPFNRAVVRARMKTHLALAAARRALAEDNVVLEQQVAQRTSQLASTLQTLNSISLETIFRLARAAEYKDEENGKHVVRMSYYTAAIARQLGLSAHAVDLLLRAAPMHDIGKIGIPDRILRKRGPLDPDEWDVMKRHTDIGGKILSGSHAEVIRLGEVCALTHHERWDGSGYPRGLRGYDIPLPGRILAVADTFDALVSKRPYKEPLTVDVALAFIHNGRGAGFDPVVVDAFAAVETEVLDIKATYEDRPEEMHDWGASPFMIAGLHAAGTVEKS